MSIGGWLSLFSVGTIFLVLFGVLAAVIWSREGWSSVAMLMVGLVLVGLGVTLIAIDDAARAKQDT